MAEYHALSGRCRCHATRVVHPPPLSDKSPQGPLPASAPPLPAAFGPGRLERLHRVSAMDAVPVADFEGALREKLGGRPTALAFDEAFYLSTCTDVAEAGGRGGFCCGYAHVCLPGRQEGLACIDGRLYERYGIASRYPADFSLPRHMRSMPTFPRLPEMPEGPGRLLLLKVDDLQEDLFYTGYSGFFSFFLGVVPLFDRVVVSVESPDFEPELVARLLPAARVVPVGDLAGLGQRPNPMAAYSHVTTARALAQFGDPARTVYFCQEYESGFFPLGAGHAFAERSIRPSRNLFVSTVMLHRYLQVRGLIAGARVCVTSPAIRPFDVQPGRTGRLFFYFRPEAFNQRNLPENVWEAAMRFCDTHEGFELYLDGTVRTAFSFERNGNRVFVMSKLPPASYVSLISSCDAVVALIYAPHPGVIATRRRLRASPR